MAGRGQVRRRAGNRCAFRRLNSVSAAAKGSTPSRSSNGAKPVFWASNPLVTLQQAEKAQSKADKKRIRQLEQELRRKDKALAEAAALLILQKADAYWSNVDEAD